MRLPYEGCIFGSALVILTLLFGDTWFKRILGVVVGLAIVGHAALTAPAEVAARKAKHGRRRRRQRDAEDEDEAEDA